MSDSCFGCCSIRAGINYIYVFNIFWITLTIMAGFMDRLSSFNQFYKNETLNPQQNANENDNSTFNDFEQSNVPLPLMSDVFMDYILIVHLGWCVMEFYLNVGLKQSTHQRVFPEKIYAWLVIYYANLTESIIFLSLVIAKNSIATDWPEYMYVFKISIIGIEVYIVRIHYNQQRLAAAVDFVQLEWKYVPKSEIQPGKRGRTARDEPDYIPIFVKNMRDANS